MKILLVEDDSYKSTAIIHWIESEYQAGKVELYNSYRDGCMAALDGCFDLLILDMALPARSQTAKRIALLPNPACSTCTETVDISAQLRYLLLGA